MFMTLGLQAMTCLISLDSCSCTTPPVWPMIIFFFLVSHPANHKPTLMPLPPNEEEKKEAETFPDSSQAPQTPHSWTSVILVVSWRVGKFNSRFASSLTLISHLKWGPKVTQPSPTSSLGPTSRSCLQNHGPHQQHVPFSFPCTENPVAMGPSPPAVGATLVVLTPRGPDDLPQPRTRCTVPAFAGLQYSSRYWHAYQHLCQYELVASEKQCNPFRFGTWVLWLETKQDVFIAEGN